MNPENIRQLLGKVKKGELSIDKALERLKTLPFEDIGFATLDHHRSLRKGFPEVIWGEAILVTRVDVRKAAQIKKSIPQISYHPVSRTLTSTTGKISKTGKGTILVISAGTSDIPVAEEAVITATIMGNKVDHLYDVGVAGIHRLVDKKEKLMSSSVLIVVAGMEGALPSVIGGLIDKPIIAVPTSTGYGTGLGGIAALLSMLNSCASGIAVVNIDNGFGAGYIASLINSV
jgi:NCAIR mutase (PurE)-related protein